MKRVLFGVTVPLTANAFLIGQLQLLSASGWEVHLATSPDDGFEDLEKIPEIHVHPIHMLRNPHPFKDIKSLISWISLIRDLKPEVTVMSTPKAGLLGTFAARICRTRTRVYHIRGLRAEGLTGLIKWLSLRSEKLAIRSATDVLCDSPSLMDALSESKLLPRDKGIVLGKGSACGVDTEYFHPPSSEEHSNARIQAGYNVDDVVIAFLGRLAIDKGITDLVTAMQRIQESPSELKMLIVGPPEVSDEAALSSTLNHVRQSDWASLRGATNDSREIYWIADILCLPSYREGFPISVLEAQACGVPVITTNATGCRDSIQDGMTGLMVPMKDIGSLQSAILALSSNDQNRRLMGNHARHWVMENFDRQFVEKRFCEYLNTITTS